MLPQHQPSMTGVWHPCFTPFIPRHRLYTKCDTELQSQETEVVRYSIVQSDTENSIYICLSIWKYSASIVTVLLAKSDSFVPELFSPARMCGLTLPMNHNLERWVMDDTPVFLCLPCSCATAAPSQNSSKAWSCTASVCRSLSSHTSCTVPSW